jgi:hypothetical protein
LLKVTFLFHAMPFWFAILPELLMPPNANATPNALLFDVAHSVVAFSLSANTRTMTALCRKQ